MVSPAPSAPTSGHHVLLGKYKLGRLLGRGSFAKVYQAQSLVDNSDVAIKVIEKSKISEAPYMEERIITEISAMHQLNHPNIIKIHEVLATKTKVYIVMEYAKGGELLSKLNRHGQFPEPIARGYFQQLLSGLHYCHVNGVTHRDIKPENLLLDHKGNLKISDFGLSALPEQLRGDGLLHTACGTPAYTAPEILRRKGYAGTKSDAWSCGVVLFAFLAARVPFNDSNIAVMYHKIRRSDFEFPSHFSTSVKSIISKLLDPNPETRMSIEEVMETAWFKKSLRRTKSNVTKACEFESMLGKDCMEPTRTSLNAFDIISMSPAFDLSPLLGATKKKKEERFPTTSSMEEIVEKVEVVGRKLGYSNIERTDRGLIGFGKKESLVLVVQALEVVNSSVYMVEVKLVGSGGGEGMTIDDEEHWNNLKLELKDLKHNDVNIAAAL